MAETDTAAALTVTWADRLQARLAGPMRRRLPRGTDPVRPLTGNAAAAQALLAGQVRFAGVRVESAGGVWAPVAPTPGFEAERQGFGWLDDLAALGTASARGAAQDWTRSWMTRFGHGHGPGWTLVLAARRLTRLLDHAALLVAGPRGLSPGRVERAFARHQRFALRRFGALPDGPLGIETAARLLVAGVALQDRDGLVAKAQAALERLCPLVVDPMGGVADRAPETLAEVFADLAFAAAALTGAGDTPGPGHRAALARAAPVLRALRHADGHLARFHGGGAGDPATIDAALAAAGLRPAPPTLLPMGYARMLRGRVSVIADGAAPAPVVASGRGGHGSTLAFELTAGNRPLIVSCGPGQGLGPDWSAAARAPAAHATLTLADPGAQPDTDAAVAVEFHPDRPVAHLEASHAAPGAPGLLHLRRLDLSLDGGELRGEDALIAVSEAAQRRQVVARVTLGRAQARPGSATPFAIRFHLHPSVEAELDAALGEVRLVLPIGEGWTFRHASACTIALDPSVYLENTRAEPAATRQIVLSGLALHQATPVRWSLTRDATAPAFLREVPRLVGAAGDDPMTAERDPT
jgi:uncharacterized heparinase superfamily protein